jgi:site-specific DNA recombinase
MLTIKIAVAEQEKRKIKQRMASGMLAKAKQGLWNYSGKNLPFGYSYDPAKKILVRNENAETVAAIFDYYLKGNSCEKTMLHFGFVSKNSTVKQILRNRTYLGIVKWRGVEYKGQHEPIISVEVFDAVQKLMHDRFCRPKNNYIDKGNLLAGLLFCGNCGGRIIYGGGSQNKDGSRRLHTRCYNRVGRYYELYNHPKCNSRGFNVKPIEETVIRALFGLSLAENFNTDPKQYSPTAKNALTTQHENLIKQIKNLYAEYAENPDKYLLEVVNEKKAKLATIEQAIADENTARQNILSIADVQKEIKTIKDAWVYFSFAEKKNALNKCIEQIIVTTPPLARDGNFHNSCHVQIIYKFAVLANFNFGFDIEYTAERPGINQFTKALKEIASQEIAQ